MDDKKDFDNLFRTYYVPLQTYAMQYLPDPDDAADAVSATFEDLWANFGNVAAATAKAYLYVSVRNHCIDTLRKRRNHEQYVAFATLMAADEVEDEPDFDGEYRAEVVERVLKELPPNTSEILQACYVRGKKYKEVAEEMQISTDTVKKHIIKALKIIREIRKKLKSQD